MPTAKKSAGSKRSTKGQKRCPHCDALMPARWFGRHLAEQHGAAVKVTAPQVALRGQRKSVVARGASAKQLTHKRQNSFRCPHCGKTFAALSGLSSHIHYLHPDGSGLERQGDRMVTQRNIATATALLRAPQSDGRRQSKSKRVRCEHCGETFVGAHRLSTHVQYRHHPDKSPAATLAQVSAPAPATVMEANSSVHSHLSTALQELTERRNGIEEQLSRMDALQLEKDAIARQIDAVNAALQAFAQ